MGTPGATGMAKNVSGEPGDRIKFCPLGALPIKRVEKGSKHRVRFRGGKHRQTKKTGAESHPAPDTFNLQPTTYNLQLTTYNRYHAALEILTAQTLSSGIFETGSRAELVNRLAAASA